MLSSLVITFMVPEQYPWESIRTTEYASPPPLVSASKAGRTLDINFWTIPHSFPLGEASDEAKPYHLNVKQRPCADVNSPYKRNDELTQWAFDINYYSE